MTQTVAIAPAAPIWHDIADAMPILTCIIDDDGQLLWTNRCWQSEIGIETDGNLWTFFSGTTGDDARAAWKADVATGRPFALTLSLPAGPVDLIHDLHLGAPGVRRDREQLVAPLIVEQCDVRVVGQRPGFPGIVRPARPPRRDRGGQRVMTNTVSGRTVAFGGTMRF